MTQQNRFSAATAHEVGYRWTIDAPEALTPAQIENFMRAACDYIGTPTDGNLELELDEFIFAAGDDPEAYLEYYDLSKDDLPLLEQITVYVEAVHRDCMIVETPKAQ